MKLPDFDDLPPVKNMPKGCAWGIFDKGGEKDRLGTLNLLTPQVVAEAASEIKTGESVSLNWPLEAMKAENQSQRLLLQHRRIDLKPLMMGMVGWDDEVHFNTQSGSQWDSLCHYGHQATGLFYNGTKITMETPDDALPSLDNWHKRGGLAGRGVLLDYKAYVEAKGIKFSPFERYAISAQDLEAVAEHQGVRFKTGDILIVRTGFTEGLGEVKTGNAQNQLMASSMFTDGPKGMAGVAATEESARWIWNKHFAAVAGDQIAFEEVHFPSPTGEMKGLGRCLTIRAVESIVALTSGPDGSPARISALPFWHEYWRTLGPEGFVGHLRQAEAMVLLHHVFAAECRGQHRFSTQCVGHLLAIFSRSTRGALPSMSVVGFSRQLWKSR